MANENTDWESLRRCIALGRNLVVQHPEIGNYYRARMTYSQIVDILQYERGFKEQGHSRSFLEEAVKWAIQGNDDEEIGVDYHGLVSEKEQRAMRNNGIISWDSEEYKHALDLRDQGFTYNAIAQMLNISHHSGKDVRKDSDVKKKIPKSKPI